uniref:MMPL family transporter n=1 Tax=uncultured Corynebacterium sp. TaxID=159447 RepID=UPI002630148D
FLANVTGSDVQTLRAEVEGTETLVGGQNAQLLDNETYAQADRRLIFPVVLGLIFVALAFALRSLVAPAIMVASVVATNVAALGLGWWISTGIFGFERFASETPLYAFVFLVALGIDYSIFLVTRARQEAAHQGTRDGIITALASTGGVITSAGILLASVFAALGILPLVALAQVGIVIFVGVLLDTLVVRTILIPALVILLGDKFWWPSRIERAEKV